MTKRKKWRSDIGKGRYACEEKSYSFWSMVMMFFTMSLTGWLWEVCFHLSTDGQFVNRGFLYGPWLPIYGFGSVMILTLLHKLRNKPLQEFVAIIMLCGCIEYCVSWFLEQVYGGIKWWDYSDYFLNLNGRICAEGLLAFGFGGMLIVYFFAPLFDKLFQRIPKKILISVCLVLIFIFCTDVISSFRKPNMGNGITR